MRPTAPNADLRARQSSWRSASSRAARTSRAPRVAAGLDDALGLLVHAGREAVQLDQEHSLRIARVAAAERVLDGLDRELVDHLHRGGNEPAAR